MGGWGILLDLEVVTTGHQGDGGEPGSRRDSGGGDGGLGQLDTMGNPPTDGIGLGRSEKDGCKKSRPGIRKSTAREAAWTYANFRAPAD